MNRKKITIYKISDNNNNVLYIGSTINYHRRLYNHKKMCVDSLKPLYTYIRNINGWNNCTMEPILETELNSDEYNKVKLILEQYYIDLLNPKYNLINSISKFKNCVERDRHRNKNKKICEDCGHSYIRRNRKQHNLTKKHLKYINNI